MQYRYKHRVVEEPLVEQHTICSALQNLHLLGLKVNAKNGRVVYVVYTFETIRRR